jgi:hypothetical protein
MSSRAAELASAVLVGSLVGVFSGAYLITMPYGAADDCLTEPKGDAPQGQHWFYRIERSSKRHCWYLRSALEKTSRVASSERSSSAKTASRKQDAPPQHLVADAHAELPSRARIEDDTSAARPAFAPVISNNTAAAANTVGVDDSSTSANAMSRWPEPIGVNSSAGALPDSTGTTVVAAAQPDAGTGQSPDQASGAADAATPSDSATSDPATASAAVITPIGKYSGSLQELMVVALAALALAGLTGSAVYRLASLGRRRRYGASRRSADWQQPKKKKPREVRPAEPRPVSMQPESFAPKPKPASKSTSKPAFHPAPRPQFAPEPSLATRSDYAPPPDHAAGPDYAPESDYAPVSEYAPKTRATPRTRELEESFESIEQLLMRLAR